MTDWYVEITDSAPESFRTDDYLSQIIDTASPCMDYFCKRLTELKDWKLEEANKQAIEKNKQERQDAISELMRTKRVSRERAEKIIAEKDVKPYTQEEYDEIIYRSLSMVISSSVLFILCIIYLQMFTK